jgi:hypothetical protein
VVQRRAHRQAALQLYHFDFVMRLRFNLQTCYSRRLTPRPRSLLVDTLPALCYSERTS